jgi:biopolymer transport protein ExbD
MSASGGKKRQGMPRAHGNEVNVTPLIDVVMCLIIFFMLVAKIGVNQGNKQMDLPYSYLGKKIDDLGNTLTLNILPKGDMEKIKAQNPNDRIPATDFQVVALVDGEERDLPIQVGDANPVHPLRDVLTKMKQRYKEQFKVIIRADADLPFILVQPTLLECANAGATNINFTTQKGEEPAAPAGGQ